MTFVKVSPKYNKDGVEKITKLWQSSLWNNHIQAERFEKFNVFGIINTLVKYKLFIFFYVIHKKKLLIKNKIINFGIKNNL